MRVLVKLVAPACLSLAVLAAPSAFAQSANTSFFLTSAGPGNGANLGGLAGADRHCQSLAQAAGAGAKTWRAYLSTQAADGQPAVNAKDRIGKGPWQNAKGAVVAKDVADLHGAGNNLTKQTALSEKSDVINGRGDTPNRHDVLTGSQPDGTAFAAGDAGSGQLALLPHRPTTIYPVDLPAFTTDGASFYATIDTLATLEGGASPLHAAIDDLVEFTTASAPDGPATRIGRGLSGSPTAGSGTPRDPVARS